MISVSIYGSHDSSICFSPATDQYRIYEFERLLKKRYAAINNISIEDFENHITRVKDIFEAEYGKKEYGSCFYAQLDQQYLDVLERIFGFKHFESMSHHAAHAAGAAYQSPFEKSLVISSDSGGHEVEDGIQTFCIFEVDKARPMNAVVKKLANLPLDVCGAYTLMAVPIAEISKTDIFSKYLSYAGKIMGLAAYGRIRPDWIDDVAKFYYGSITMDNLKKLGDNIGLDLSDINTISGQDAYDLAATSQEVFELVTYTAILPFIERYRLPVILTGGGALNVLFNQQLSDNIDYPVFIPCNPSDCGLSFGMMMLREPANKQVNISYSGFGILDIDSLEQYAKKHEAVKVDIKFLAALIAEGQIVGVLRGNSEAGPRALGNRSILCNPTIPGIKDKLNSKIKFREWFRPFGPVIHRDDSHSFFENNGIDSPFMTFAPRYHEGVFHDITAVVHKDGTGRVQTVTESQNKFLYQLLTEVGKFTAEEILLNTSFNIKGKPILTTIEDALYILENTELDHVLVEDYLFSKKR